MEIFNHIYCTEPELESFLQNTPALNSPKTLVQLFCGTDNMAMVQEVLDQLSSTIPEAKVIGASTAGEILAGEMLDGTIVVACTVFEHTTIGMLYVPDTNFQNGHLVAAQLVNAETKALICFSEGLASDSEGFIRGIATVDSSVVLAGGNAADNNHFKKTYIISGGEIYETGSVVAALDSSQLQVLNAYTLNWQPIGHEFVVTKVIGNRVYELDNKPIIDICRRYLGDDAAKNLPASIVEFPLIKTVELVPIARSIVAVHDDGAFQFAGNFSEGDRVRFSVGNVDAALKGAVKLVGDISESPAEVIYIYSCTARKMSLQGQLGVEFSHLNKVAPTCGFFTYGDYYHTDTTNQILNVTTTALVLSETSQISTTRDLEEIEIPVSATQILTHLVGETQRELEESVHLFDQYKNAVDASAIVSKTDLAGMITYVNDRFCEISGYQRSELIGQNHNIMRHEDIPREVFKEMWETISSGLPWQGTLKNLNKSGQSYYVEAIVMPIFGKDGGIREYIAIRHDITKIIRQEQRIRTQTTDELTNLPNRIQLLEDIRSTKQPNLVLLDIDKFFTVNDLYGIKVADNVLIQTSLRLNELVADCGSRLYRVANDVFAILYEEGQCSAGHVVAAKLQQLFSEPFSFNGIEIHLSCTCGIAKGKKSLFRFADMALHEAKQKHIPFSVYDDGMAKRDEHEQNFLWLKKLRDAFVSDRIEPFFQPIVDNASGEIKKYEALVRVIQDDGTPALPFFFLDIAKNAKLYPDLTKMMTKKALALLSHTPFEVSLNISVEDVVDEQTVTFILEMMEKSGAADRVVLEITESEGFENFDEVLLLTSKVKKMGGKIAIDDFGTGYSNFSYLLKLRPDYIKIDGSIIKNILKDKNAEIVAKTL
ncbi:MAG: EAL domain-containing protein, partial [Desulfuromonadales bacterium]|nr:EAL domain-containing protein [Desulfuromonadales bacterium]